MTYALLIYRTSPPLASLAPQDERQALARHRALQAETAQRGELHAVARLDAPATARTVRAQAESHEMTDGPFIETKEWLVGFYVVDCESEAQALERARQICTDEDHAVEVRPLTWRWRP